MENKWDFFAAASISIYSYSFAVPNATYKHFTEQFNLILRRL